MLVWSGIATLAFGAVGMRASQQLARLAGYSVIASSGTLVAAIGSEAPALGGGALFYLASSTLAGCALFLLVELLERSRQVEVGPPQLDDGNDALPAFLDAEPPSGTNLDDNEEALIGRDVLWSATQVAVGVWRAQAHPPRGTFVVVPGTVWSELAPDRRALLIHVFDLDDEAAFIEHFKTDYEQPLKEIFE